MITFLELNGYVLVANDPELAAWIISFSAGATPEDVAGSLRAWLKSVTPRREKPTVTVGFSLLAPPALPNRPSPDRRPPVARPPARYPSTCATQSRTTYRNPSTLQGYRSALNTHLLPATAVTGVEKFPQRRDVDLAGSVIRARPATTWVHGPRRSPARARFGHRTLSRKLTATVA